MSPAVSCCEKSDGWYFAVKYVPGALIFNCLNLLNYSLGQSAADFVLTNVVPVHQFDFDTSILGFQSKF